MATKTSKSPAELVELAAFEMALKVLDSACGGLQTFFLSPLKGSGCLVSGTSNGSSAVFKIGATIKGLESPIEVQKDVFLSSLKGRKEGSLSLDGATLLIKAKGGYEATVVCAASENAPTVELPEGLEITQLTSELHAHLAKRLPEIKIERIHTALPDVLAYIRLTPKSSWMGTFDSQQVCFCSDKKANLVKSPVAFCIPYTRFASFIKDLPVADCKLAITQDNLYATTNTFKLQIALPVSDEESALDPATVYERSKAMTSASGSGVSISKAELQQFMENSRALMSIGTEITFEPSKTGTQVGVRSERGSVKQTLKTSGKTDPFSLDHRFVHTLIQKTAGKKAKDEEDTTGSSIDFEVVDNTFALCKSSVVYVALLSAMSEKKDD